MSFCNDCWENDKKHTWLDAVCDECLEPNILELQNDKILTLFDGGYGRVGYIVKYKGKCDVCGKETDIIAMDATEDEHAVGCICYDCVKKAFK